MSFTHLKYVKQNYSHHFLDTINYSCMSFKASFYFFVHALWPDAFEFNGSREIEKLNELLMYKRRGLIMRG